MPRSPIFVSKRAGNVHPAPRAAQEDCRSQNRVTARAAFGFMVLRLTQGSRAQHDIVADGARKEVGVLGEVARPGGTLGRRDVLQRTAIQQHLARFQGVQAQQALASALLPAPTGPVTATRAPAGMSSQMSCRAGAVAVEYGR